MFSKLTTKIALRKAGIPSSTFSDFDSSAAPKQNAKSSQGDWIPFDNPFKNATMPKSLQGWATPEPPPINVLPVPKAGERAPSSNPKLRLPGNDGRPAMVAFLRHCGCPFAEKTFLELRRLSNKYPYIAFIAVSHCSQAATDRWVKTVGGAWGVKVVVDEQREIYAQWGLGVSNTYHLINYWTPIQMRKLGTSEGIWAREISEGGNRWQIGGAWAVDEKGEVRWGKPMDFAYDLPDLTEGCKALGAY